MVRSPDSPPLFRTSAPNCSSCSPPTCRSWRDLPRQLAERLAGSEAEAVLALDAAGREQPVCAAYRTDALRAAIADLGDPGGAAMRQLLQPPASRTVHASQGYR